MTLFFLAGALIATVWRPLVLGFLTDDWTVLVEPAMSSAPFSEARWQALEIAQNRPVLRAIFFLLTSLVLPSPAIWHTVGTVLNVAAGAAVAVCVHDLLVLANIQRRIARWSGAYAGLCWIAFPWSVATQFWATGTTAMPAVVCFAASVSLLVRHWQGSTPALIAGAALSLAGYLTYEAFYFQVFPVIAYLAWTQGWRSRSSGVAALSYSAAQLGALAFNQMMRLQGAEGARRINPDFLDTFFHWYLYIGRFAGMPKFAVFAGLIVAIVAIAACLWTARRWAHVNVWSAILAGAALVCAGAVLITLPLAFPETIALSAAGLAVAGYLCLRSSASSETGGIGPIMLLALIQIALGALPFALGNYVIFAAGFGARATLASSLWIALALGAIAAVVVERAAVGRLVIAALAMVWLGFALGDGLRAREWGRAATLLDTVFRDPPPFPFEQAKPDAAYILVGPEQSGWVPVIEVNHHVAAIARIAFLPQAATPAQKTTLHGWGSNWIVARTQIWSTAWDGSRLTQKICRGGETFNTLSAPELWVWDTAARTIRKMTPPYAIGCTVRN